MILLRMNRKYPHPRFLCSICRSQIVVSMRSAAHASPGRSCTCARGTLIVYAASCWEQAHRFAQRGHLPAIHAAGNGRPAVREVLAQEHGQEGRHQVVDALHVPAGGVPARPAASLKVHRHCGKATLFYAHINGPSSVRQWQAIVP